MSVWSALARALGPEAVAHRLDATMFGSFTDFDAIRSPLRERVVRSGWNPDVDLAGRDVLVGHLSLPTLRRVTAAENVATILREPRSRLLSQYAYLRTTPGLAAHFAPYELTEPAQRPLEDFLADPCAAVHTDNTITRYLLGPDPRLPPAGFVRAADVDGLAADAAASLDELGCVVVVERPGEMWFALSGFFDAVLQPLWNNRTEASEASPLARVDARAVELLEARTSVDRRVYAHALALRGVTGAAADKVAAEAYAGRLSRYSSSAAA